MKNTTTNTIAEMVRNNTGNIPVLDVIKNIPLATTVSKLTKSPTSEPTHNRYGNRETIAPDVHLLYQDVVNKMTDISDAESVMQLLPDTNLALEILVSSISSPKDMGAPHLNYIVPTTIVPHTISTRLQDVIRDYFDDDYKIATRIPEWLRHVLGETGSYPIAVIPENVIDEIINNAGISGNGATLESLSQVLNLATGEMKSTGILGHGNDVNVTADVKNKLYNQYTLESFVKQSDVSGRIYYTEEQKTHYSGVHVTDNLAILSLATLSELNRSAKVKSILSPKMQVTEALSVSDRDLERLFYGRINYEHQPVVSLKKPDQSFRHSMGEPLIMHLPSESVLPVYTPGSPSRHIGYYVLLDNNHHPISRETSVNHYADMKRMTQLGQSNNFASGVISRVNKAINGCDNQISEQARLERYIKAYGDMIETDLLARIRNGIYGETFRIGDATEIYRVMFFRALENQETQLLFIPAELMTYMAFKYNTNGTGRSLLDDLKVVNSLRVALMLAENRSMVQNSINRTNVDVTLDPHDPNPDNTMNLVMSEFFKKRSPGSGGMPIGMTDPSVFEDWASKAGVTFNFKGHPSIPDMDVDIQETNTSMPVPDSDLAERMDKRASMGMGVPYENIDAANGADFEVNVLQKNALFNTRVAFYQSNFEPFLTQHAIQVMQNSPKVIGDMTDIILQEFDEVVKFALPERDIPESISDSAKLQISRKLAEAFINGVKCELPKTNILPLKAKLEAFEEYETAIEKGIEIIMNDAILDETNLGELAGRGDNIRDLLKYYLLREWMIKNDFLSEINELVYPTEDEMGAGSDLYSILTAEGTNLSRVLAGFSKRMNTLSQTTDQYMQSNEITESDGYSSDSGSSDDDSSGNDSGGGDADPFGFGGDSGGDPFADPFVSGDDGDGDGESSEE